VPPRQLKFAPEPQVELYKAFDNPFRNALATARTCYSSKGIINDEDIDLDRWGDLARSIYKAGHHTTFQHAHFQFRLSGVSRQFIWSFLHSHPFYNSEQVSQRYVKMQPGNYAIPPLDNDARRLFTETVERQTGAYEKLIEMLMPVAGEAYFSHFPYRRKNAEAWRKDIHKKAMEIARYVLPVATHAYLYHTISGVTLLRYWRMCRSFDAPLEQKIVVEKMVRALIAFDPSYELVLEDPLEEEAFPEQSFFQHVAENEGTARDFIREFDDRLGGRCSLLVDFSARAEETLGRAVREVLGQRSSALTDEEAIRMALDPAVNPLLGESLVLTTHGKLTRALYHPSYTFMKKLSHTADSQDQRHRMTPASRPVLAAHLVDEPDYITPSILENAPEAFALYTDTMESTWESVRRLRSMGVPDEFVLYLLPNAVPIRFTESADLLNLHHKHAMRLCYNAQEEIWRASVDEAEQIRDVHPRIGRFLLPPCAIRHRAGKRPVCPEGDRFCGIKVWQLDLEEYRRSI